MQKHRIALVVFVIALAARPAILPAQGRPDPAVVIAAQKEAMAKLAFMDGVWRGPAWTITPSGEKHNLTQTERVGPFLDGSVKIVEGKGYTADGKVTFNALGVISYNVEKRTYNFRTYAQGNVGDFVLTLTADGVSWEIPVGPMTIRNTAVIKDGVWKEVGERIMPGRDPVRFVELILTRIGDSNWPAAGSVSPK